MYGLKAVPFRRMSFPASHESPLTSGKNVPRA
jgi:hypothetical protein